MNNVLLCDTCVIIDYINEHDELLQTLKDNHFVLFVNSIIEMELLYGAHDQKELKKIQQKMTLFRRLEINQDTLDMATELVKQYSLSHRLHPADAVVAATTLTYVLRLFTHNKKDFRYLPDVCLWDSSSFHP